MRGWARELIYQITAVFTPPPSTERHPISEKIFWELMHLRKWLTAALTVEVWHSCVWSPKSSLGNVKDPVMKPRLTVCFLLTGRKVRLFHFLFEMLEDPSMAHCVSWVPAAAGVFRFSSTNKDQLAALWGQRKGNKRPMTYQKMSRALRNYARSGEIFKVKKKLTYQFSENTLMLLHKRHRGDL